MNDDAYRDPPPPRDTEGPTALWAKAFARLRLAAHPAHIGPLGLSVLLCAHNVSWLVFLAIAAVSGIVAAMRCAFIDEDESKRGRQTEIVIAVWAGIFCILGALFGT